MQCIAGTKTGSVLVSKACRGLEVLARNGQHMKGGLRQPGEESRNLVALRGSNCPVRNFIDSAAENSVISQSLIASSPVLDDHLEITVPGLFGAGDVVIGLDQISHAMGQAGVAATAIRNHLAREKPIRR